MANKHSGAEIDAWLAANLPTWSHAEDHLTCTYTTGNWQLTLLLAGAIGYLAEAGWHHPELTLTYPRLTVRLQTHDAGGVTDKDFELARKIEEIATWQPAESDALEGRPDRWVK